MYDLSRAMDGTDYAHIIVVKHRDKEEYQGKYIIAYYCNRLQKPTNFAAKIITCFFRIPPFIMPPGHA